MVMIQVGLGTVLTECRGRGRAAEGTVPPAPASAQPGAAPGHGAQAPGLSKSVTGT